MSSFEKKYADILEGVMVHGKTERKLLHEMENELLEFVDPDVFMKVFRIASNFPDMEQLEGRTYQISAFIGYLRGCSDILDSFSQHLKYSLLEYPDEDE